MDFKFYEYQTINVSTEPSPDPHGFRKATVQSTANRWAKQGWRTVSVIPSQGPGYADAILVERRREPIGVQAVTPDATYYFKPEEIRFIFPEDGV